MNHSTQSSDITDEERLAGRTALNIHSRPSYQDFDQSILDEYFSGKIGKEKESAFFEYLDGNPDAYHAWVEQAKTHTQNTTRARNSSRSLAAFIKDIFTSSSHGFAYAGVACTVVALTIVFSLPNPATRSITQRLDEGFASLKDLPEHQHIEELVMPWDAPTNQQAFSPTPETSAEEIAFANGLELEAHPIKATGNAADANENSSELNKHLATYQNLGRWNVLVWSACVNHENVPDSFWSQQLETAQLLVEALESSDNDIFTNHLNRSIQLLTQMSQVDNKSGLSKKLQKELEQFRLLYAPREKPKA